MTAPKALYTVDGSIGSGKSTLLRLLAAGPHAATVVPEPVADWDPLLQRAYAGEQGAAFALQMRVWLDRCSSAFPDGSVVERSPEFQFHTFVELGSHLGSFETREAQILRDIYSLPPRVRPTKMVYLRSTPKECLLRIRAAPRTDSDVGVTLRYLELLHELHETAYAAMVADWKPGDAEMKVINVEGKTPEQVCEDVQAFFYGGSIDE
jgi:deoxyadenosine/deoxycytidine kinase